MHWFHTVLAWRSYERHRQQHTEISIVSEVSETESHPSTLPATSELPANSRKRKGKKRKKEKILCKLLSLASRGKGLIPLLPTTYYENPSLSKTRPGTAAYSFHYNHRSLFPICLQWAWGQEIWSSLKFWFSQFNPLVREAHHKFYKPYQWRAGTDWNKIFHEHFYSQIYYFLYHTFLL